MRFGSGDGDWWKLESEETVDITKLSSSRNWGSCDRSALVNFLGADAESGAEDESQMPRQGFKRWADLCESVTAVAKVKLAMETYELSTTLTHLHSY